MLQKVKMIERLNNFVNLYGKWINNQKQKQSTNKEIEDNIFENLDYNLKRLESNINLLKDD